MRNNLNDGTRVRLIRINLLESLGTQVPRRTELSWVCPKETNADAALIAVGAASVELLLSKALKKVT